MALGDFADLYLQACYMANRDHTDTAFDIPRAKEAVNTICMEVCALDYPFRWLQREYRITISSAGPIIDLNDVETQLATPLGIHKISHIIDVVNDTTGTGPLKWIPWRVLEKITNSTSETGETTGEPTQISRLDRNYRLYPPPDQQYTLALQVKLREGEMTSDTHTPLIPVDRRRSVVVPGAAAILLRQEGGAEAANEADRAEAKYTREVTNLVNDTGATSEEETMLMEPTVDDYFYTQDLYY